MGSSKKIVSRTPIFFASNDPNHSTNPLTSSKTNRSNTAIHLPSSLQYIGLGGIKRYRKHPHFISFHIISYHFIICHGKNHGKTLLFPSDVPWKSAHFSPCHAPMTNPWSPRARRDSLARWRGRLKLTDRGGRFRVRVFNGHDWSNKQRLDGGQYFLDLFRGSINGGYPKISGLFHGQSYEYGWFGGTPI